MIKNLLSVLVSTVLAFPAGQASAETPGEFFENRIRPVLVESCVKCHGGEKVSSGLRLDDRKQLFTGGDRGRLIEPGDASSSLLVQVIQRTHPDVAMPPKSKLSARVIDDFRRWIDSGAHWPDAVDGPLENAERHWAFVELENVTVPPIEGYAHPIDRFIAARREELGLRPVARADRRTLIRRASFDLTGLPPDWERTSRFIEDPRPGAFAELVNELLSSPRYGERWGRHWLDLARYADTAGENSDYPIPQVHLYRDYVINSFNADKPYDEFIREQIAGDIIGAAGSPEEYAQRVIATGFIAQAKRFGTNDLEDMHLIIEDTLDTMGKVVLGLGLRCARCHDHKYDPTTTEDYYGLYGFFQSTAYPFPGGESVREQRYFVSTIHPTELAKADEDYLAQHSSEIERLKQLIADKKDVEEHTKALTAINENAPSRQAPVAYAVEEGKPTDAFVQHGGNPRHRGETVRRRVPEFLRTGSISSGEVGQGIPEGESGRLQLARWLTDPRNPLTARVMVNRIWQYHFGKPIVPTPSNFGLQGAPPSHPELLDWLATQFIKSGWSIKAMHRLIMTSETYQLATDHDPKNAAIDAGNECYWRFNRQRMDAESIRDSMLLLGGNLDLSRHTGHPFPTKDKWKWTAHRQFKAVYPSNHRSVYMMVQRLHPHPFLSIFNGPDTSASTAVRDQSTVPLQALFMTNSNLIAEQARGLAASLQAACRASGIDRDMQIEETYKRIVLRAPNVREIRRASEFIHNYLGVLSDEGVPAEERELLAWSGLIQALLTSNEFLFVD